MNRAPMPKADIPVGYLKAEFEGIIGSFTWANVMYFAVDQTGTVSAADVLAVATGLHNAFASSFQPHCASGTVLHLTKVRYRDTDGTSVWKTAYVADVAGGASGSTEPAQCCLLINWYTLDGRKGGKARTYIAGIGDGHLDNEGVLNAAGTTAWTPAPAAFLTAIAAVSHGSLAVTGMVEMSFVEDKAFRVTPFPYPIYNGAPSPYVATQRRRIDRAR